MKRIVTASGAFLFGLVKVISWLTTDKPNVQEEEPIRDALLEQPVAPTPSEYALFLEQGYAFYMWATWLFGVGSASIWLYRAMSRIVRNSRRRRSASAPCNITFNILNQPMPTSPRALHAINNASIDLNPPALPPPLDVREQRVEFDHNAAFACPSAPPFPEPSGFDRTCPQLPESFWNVNKRTRVLKQSATMTFN